MGVPGGMFLLLSSDVLLHYILLLLKLDVFLILLGFHGSVWSFPVSGPDHYYNFLSLLRLASQYL